MKSTHWLVRYVIAVLVVLASLPFLRIPVIGEGLGTVLFLAVLISAWQGGFGAGLFATVLIEFIAVVTLRYLQPDWSIKKFVELISFFVAGLVISVLVEALHAARRRAEASQQWLSAVLTCIGDAVIATNDRGRVVFINPVAESLCGWKAGEAAGRPLDEVFRIIDENTRDPVENPVERVLATGVVAGLANHTVLISRDGIERPIDDSGAPIRNSQDAIVGVVLVFRDVSERRVIEKEMQESARRKDEFLAMLAHELRNPLAAVANAVQLLQRPGAGGFLDWCKEVIDRQVKHLTRLVDDLLDVSRITRGKIQLRLQTIDLAAVLRASADSVRPLFQERNLEFHTAIESEPIFVEADPTRLEQIFVNLLNNAAKYTEPGGRIDLDARLDGGYVRIRVCDNGVGIAPDLLPHIFDPFTQGDRSLARSEGGLGIGLTMVSKLVEMHGGTVTAESGGPGRGSTFTVRFPILREPPSTHHAPAGVARQISKTRILLIEDNVDLALSMSRLLRILGHETATAHDGATGIQAAHDFHPELILLDIGLPGMDGFEVIRKLRQDEATKDIRVIAITGYGQEEDRHRALAAGFNDHLAKPIDQNTLVTLLQGSDGSIHVPIAQKM